MDYSTHRWIFFDSRMQAASSMSVVGVTVMGLDVITSRT